MDAKIWKLGCFVCFVSHGVFSPLHFMKASVCGNFTLARPPVSSINSVVPARPGGPFFVVRNASIWILLRKGYDSWYLFLGISRRNAFL